MGGKLEIGEGKPEPGMDGIFPQSPKELMVNGLYDFCLTNLWPHG